MIKMQQLMRFMAESRAQDDIAEQLEAWQIDGDAMSEYMLAFIRSSIESYMAGQKLDHVIMAAFWCGLEIGYKSAMEITMQLDRERDV